MPETSSLGSASARKGMPLVSRVNLPDAELVHENRVGSSLHTQQWAEQRRIYIYIYIHVLSIQMNIRNKKYIHMCIYIYSICAYLSINISV